MAKVSTATIRLVMKKCKVNDMGEHPIYLSVCYNGRKEKSTGVFIQERFWNSQREEVRKTCPNAIVLNRMLSELKLKVINRRNEYEHLGKAYTPSMLLDEGEVVSANVNEYRVLYKRYLEDMASSANTIKLYDYNYRVLKRYFGKEDFVIQDITALTVKKLIKSLDLGDNSIRGICGRIASVWNYAIRKGIVDSSEYPFRDFVYSQKYKKANRIYYLEDVNLIKLRDWFIDRCLNTKGGLWGYKEGIEDRLMNRSSKEFAILFFLMLYRFNGSAPVDIARLKVDNCSRVTIDGVDYWRIEFKRKKTGMPVKCVLKRDILTIVGFEHFLGRSVDGYVYPILKDGMSDKQIINAVGKFTGYSVGKLRDICEEVNQETIRNNVEKGLDEPLIDVQKVVYYTARHTLANSYLNSPSASVGVLASLMGRSADTISAYIHSLRGDRDVADAVGILPI